MANWQWNTYSKIKDAETAVEQIDSTVTLHVFGFKDGLQQKICVINSA